MARRVIMRCRSCGYEWPVVIIPDDCGQIPPKRAVCLSCGERNDPIKDIAAIRTDDH